ncbi:MAG TPA: alkaline phosphatase family protein [Pyrinomonadaceae bacterium]|nr:alkaline phosphatase family protein [Pyrinomonadaceae bacterium]
MRQYRLLRHTTAVALTLLLLIVSLAGPDAQRRQSRTDATSANTARAASAQAAQQGFTRPKLVLLIAVDQFRYDYLERFDDLFVPGGLRRLMQEGAFWTGANYDHTPTYTAPGHATMMTGAWPSETGIIANDWPDLEKGRNITSVEDEQSRLLGGLPEEKASSPHRLMASTIGDELRMATNERSKVIGISIKDRSAILPAGRHANAAYWFSTTSGRMVTSSYYLKQMPQWVTAFNETRPADKFFGARWERLLPEGEYVRRVGSDAPAWEDIGVAPGETNKFPHVITGGATAPGTQFYTALDYSPFTNDILLSFTKLAITNEQLGEDADTDVLTVSFSANDYIGHRYGPYSHEVMDATLRVDRQIEELLKFVDARVGLRNTLVVFTSDHGVGQSPEESLAKGLPGRRITSAEVLSAMKSAISARYNPKNQQPDPTSNYIQAFYNGNVYFNRALLKRDGIDPEEIERVAGEGSLTVPGMFRYFTRTQLMRRSISPGDALSRRVMHGFYPERSGDVIVVYQPFRYFETAVPVTHGSPYAYDTHVPLILMGTSFRAGRYLEAAAPSDIAPTLAAVLRLQTPSNSVGRVLTDCIIQNGAGGK